MNFKKILSFVLALAMVVCAMSTVAFAQEEPIDEVIIEEAELAEEVAEEADAELMAEKLYSGRGTESEPYSIGTLEELVAFANDVNAGLYKNVFIYVELTADIDVDQCNDTVLFPDYAWTPIGTNSNAFQGVFNGNNHTISNLWLGAYDYNGFFGCLGNNPEKPAEVKDLILEYPAGVIQNYSGIVAGKAFTANINNVHVVDAGVYAGSVTYVGGLVGHGYVTFNNCSLTGMLDTSAVQVGGLLGSGQCIAYNCSVDAEISGSIWVGGICGNAQENYVFENNYVKGSVSAEQDYYGASAAGIVCAPYFSPAAFRISIKNNYCDAVLTCNDEPVNAPIIGGFNNAVALQDYAAVLESSVDGNSWNRTKVDLEELVAYGLGETANPFVDERNNALVATESDLNYLNGVAKEDVVLMEPFATENGVDEKSLEQVYGISEIVVEFEKVTPATAEGEMVYNINLKGKDGVKINRLNSADLEFVLNTDNGDIKYEILASNDEVTINEVADGRYEFHYAGKDDADSDTANVITIGQVKFTGIGQFDFAVKVNTTNEVHATTFFNNIVDTFIPGGSATDATKGILTIDNALIEDAVIEIPTRELEVQIDFNNAADKNVIDYQDMTVVVSGGDLAEEIVIELGDTTYTTALDIFGKSSAKYTVDATADNKYVVTVSGALASETTYTVTVKGAGYRTVRKNISMNEDATVDNVLTYWNNVKDADGADFLAGDIVKDNTINVYDLSAVVSYFGRANNTSAESKFAKYDLNRDGKIDSKDVAYVLVSWGK